MRLRRHLFPLLVPVVLLPSLWAHGGQYRGPSNVTPPAGGSGGTATGPGGGNTSSPGSATAGGAGAAGAPKAPPVGGVPVGSPPGGGVRGGGPAGVPLDDDLTRWEFWWEFGKDPYLRLRDALVGNAIGADEILSAYPWRAREVRLPTEVDIVSVVLPALKRALDAASDRDTISASMVALAKIGRDHPDWKLVDQFRPRLAQKDQEVRETAALALGIAGRDDKDSIDLLLELAQDGPLGRKVSDQAHVNDRTRTFAVYALGLLLQRALEPRHGHRIAQVLTGLVADSTSSRNLRVAAIESLALLDAGRDDAGSRALRDAAIDALATYYRADLGPGAQLVQAHCPTALARLLGQGHARSAEFRALFAADLAADLPGANPAAGQPRRVNPHIAQSCALALGRLCAPWDDDKSADAGSARLLHRVYREHRDHQARSFALVALAQLGGERALATLLDEVSRATRGIELPWIAIALGVFEAREFASAERAGRRRDVNPRVSEPLRRLLSETKNPGALGALAIASGLCRDLEAGDVLRRLLQVHGQREDLAGYLCIGLSLMRDDRATRSIQEMMQSSVRRPQVLLQSAAALGRLGDANVTTELCRMLTAGDGGLSRFAAIASALGQIGDRSSIAPLVEALGDARLTSLTRAFAAVALGGVCDKDPLPWNACFATTLNYRAAVETLTDGSSGILDIL